MTRRPPGVLFPQARTAVAAAAAEMPVTDPAYDVEAARARAREVAARQPREDVARVHDVDAGGVPGRAYLPEGAVDGLVVHVHGGGFVFNDVDVHDGICRAFANRVGMAVLSVDYRRPPEARFPAAVDDVDTVMAWLGDGGLESLVPRSSTTDEVPVFAHGDSAGANLALVAALRHPGRFRAVALIYPFLDPGCSFPSHAMDGVGFDRAEAEWYWQQYAATPADLTDPDLAPLLSDQLHTLPSTLVVTAEHDPLRDEGEHLAGLLAEQGVDVVATRQLGMTHGFWRHLGAFNAAEPLVWQVAGFLRSRLP